MRKSPPLGVLGGPVAVSLRLSCQTTWSLPAFASTSGKNWWPFPCPGVIRDGLDQAVPSSVRIR